MKGLFQCPPRASPWVITTQTCRPVGAKALKYQTINKAFALSGRMGQNLRNLSKLTEKAL